MALYLGILFVVVLVKGVTKMLRCYPFALPVPVQTTGWILLENSTISDEIQFSTIQCHGLRGD